MQKNIKNPSVEFPCCYQALIVVTLLTLEPSNNVEIAFKILDRKKSALRLKVMARLPK